ncbi:uncharacterized protein LOC109830523 isoform X2 [Asparagus officinalis]|uniref:uncharacterized protein LOC109830523 isoform X2 n=1 Tax=Asparagus officinalis TaxID=4686 RepID=UPI00098E4BD8|nr:uncharacterized protein LOC109830523 isoform X2 [Asparagus officinalis]
MLPKCLLKFPFEPRPSSNLGSNHQAVHDFIRIHQLNPRSTSRHYLHTTSHSYITRSKFLRSRKSFEGYIPGTCTALSFPVSSQLTSSDAPQRSEEWFSLRKDKLTTSTFSTALGFWKGNRRSELWYEKVFSPAVDTFDSAARAAMDWGVSQEANAIDQYKIITGHDVSLLGFAVHAEAQFGWLGASPDGLLDCYPDCGILEVKCPYNKGKPELALPWQSVPYYYMPQLQGQMEIMDRDWVDLYCWTPNGSAIFRVVRDKEYWELMHGVLSEFWWGNVMPAREAMLLGKEVEARAYEPKPKHGLTGFVIGRSRKLACEANMLCRDIGGHVEFF